MTAVANDETAIGYISLGSLNDTVKAVTVGGVAASAETVKDGSYVLARPFNIVTNGDATDPVAVDFIAYCLSKDGQALATDKGYIGEDGADYTSAQPVKQDHRRRLHLRLSADGKADQGPTRPSTPTPSLSCSPATPPPVFPARWTAPTPSAWPAVS